MIAFFQANEVYIFAILYAGCKILSAIPSIKANSIEGFIVGGIIDAVKGQVVVTPPPPQS